MTDKPARAARRMTDASIRKLKPHAVRRELPDTTAGLYVIDQPGGARSFAMRFRRPSGAPAKLSLGPLAHKDDPVSDHPSIGDVPRA